MKTTVRFLLLSIFMLPVLVTNAQITTTANNSTNPADFVGWDANPTNNFPLYVKHDLNQNIIFSTRGFNRMLISNGGNTINDGKVGFGHMLAPTFVPLDRLHSSTNVLGDNMFRFSNMNYNGFRVGLSNTAFGNGVGLFDLQDPILFRFDIRNQSNTSQYTKVTINNINQNNTYNPYQASYSDVARVGIWNGAGPTNGATALAMLHLGYAVANTAVGPLPYTLNNFGHRDWMNIGTYCNSSTTDYMYVGIKEYTFDGIDAVIAWGDNPVSSGTDRMKFIFTDVISASGLPSQTGGGLEVMRLMTPTGSDGRVLVNIDPASPNLDPQNTLHIVGQSASGTATTAGGNSGLRFQFLKSTTPTVSNPGSGLLSVNANGDVIYVNAPSGGGSLGNLLCAAPNPIPADYEIPLNNFNFTFSSDLPMTNKVNVGYNCSTALLPGKLNATTAVQSNSIAGYPQSITMYANNTYSSPGTSSTGVFGEATNPVGKSDAIGVWGKGTADGSAYGVRGDGLAGHIASYGGFFSATTAMSNGGNFGVFATASGSTNVNFGVTGFGNGGMKAVGGKFLAGGASQYSIGVEALALPTSGFSGPNTYTGFYPQANIGIYAAGDPLNSASGTPGQYWAGWFDGDVYINGQGYYTGFVTISDRKFKEDIKPIENATAIITKLNPTNYYFNTKTKHGIRFSDKRQFGFISQEVETVLPDLVEDVHKPAMVDEEGNVKVEAMDYKGLNYIGFIALLTKGMQEQQVQIQTQQEQLNVQQTQLDDQRRVNESLQQQIDELKSLVRSTISDPTKNATGSTQNIQLSNKNVIVLNQNAPNPFAESTVITYTIPSTFTKAQMIFTTVDGKVMRTVDITTKGDGQLNVFADDLSSGIYTYTLVVDGKTIASKSMIKN